MAALQLIERRKRQGRTTSIAYVPAAGLSEMEVTVLCARSGNLLVTVRDVNLLKVYRMTDKLTLPAAIEVLQPYAADESSVVLLGGHSDGVGGCPSPPLGPA